MAADESKWTSDETPERLRVRWRTGSNGIGCFFLFWMTGWTVGCVFIASVAWKNPEFQNVAGAVVFWCGWFFGLIMLVGQFLGRELLLFSPDGLTIIQGRLLRTRTFVPISEIFGFTTEHEGMEGDGKRSGGKQLEVRTAGRPIRCGSGLSGPEIQAVASSLRAYQKKLPTRLARDSAWPPERERIVFRPKRSFETPDHQTAFRSQQESPLEKPSDSRMRRRDDFDAVQFWTRGRTSLAGIFAVALINAFWSGIAGIFVYNLYWGGPADKPQGFEWYKQFLFLIPFELVGIVMFLGLLLIIIDPLRVWSYQFTTTEVRERLTWLGIGWRKKYDLGLLDRIEVRRMPYEVAKMPKRLNLATLWTPAGSSSYSLVVVEMGNREVCSLDGFTFGEACWMADAVVRRSDFPWAD